MADAQMAGGSVVLMARVLDAAGQPLMPAAINSIRFSCGQLGDELPKADRLGMLLDLKVDEVIFDCLQEDDAWKLDSIGYNFRHVTQLGSGGAAGALYCLRYEFTLQTGRKAILRFDVRHKDHERN